MAKLVPTFRSDLEGKIAKQLDSAGIKYGYESKVVKFTVPARTAKYNPDFVIDGTSIIIEGKGRFGHRGNDSAGAKVRQHLILAKQQNPDLDIRIVFQNATLPIYKGAKTTYAEWAEDHGFKWSDKGMVPSSWLKEMKR
jgi:hypothetical protein